MTTKRKTKAKRAKRKTTDPEGLGVLIVSDESEIEEAIPKPYNRLDAAKYGILGGRPMIFKEPPEIVAAILEYLSYCEETRRLPNKAGLCVFLGIARSTLEEYEKKDGFSAAIRETYGYIEDEWIQRLARAYPQGAIFYLKNAFKYREESSPNQGNINITFSVPKEIAEKYQILEGEKPTEVVADIDPTSLIDQSVYEAPSEPTTDR